MKMLLMSFDHSLPLNFVAGLKVELCRLLSWKEVDNLCIKSPERKLKVE